MSGVRWLVRCLCDGGLVIVIVIAIIAFIVITTVSGPARGEWRLFGIFCCERLCERPCERAL